VGGAHDADGGLDYMYVLTPGQAQVLEFVKDAPVHSLSSQSIVVGQSSDGVLVLDLSQAQRCREMLKGFVPVFGVPRLPGISLPAHILLLAGVHAPVPDLVDIVVGALLLSYLPSAEEIHP